MHSTRQQLDSRTRLSTTIKDVASCLHINVGISQMLASCSSLPDPCPSLVCSCMNCLACPCHTSMSACPERAIRLCPNQFQVRTSKIFPTYNTPHDAHILGSYLVSQNELGINSNFRTPYHTSDWLRTSPLLISTNACTACAGIH